MADNKKKKLTKTQQEYQAFAKDREPNRPLVKNCIAAYIVGGGICVVGQIFSEMYKRWFDFTDKTVGDPTVATMVFIGVLLTGFGVYDKIAQWGGAGTAVPVTGFANSIASAAMEHRSEGLVLGIGGNMFKLAGSVIVFGVVAAFVIGIIHTLIKMGG
ncbi:MAG: stage V sporulation protein AC [Bacilli bacterium]